ncbi:ATP-binding protein [Vreelandella rituensis]|uniref:ATP-binding protein n=1 Tax=Vreelandella rituensis TaxID=2282306 RepID=A0A368U9T5_9GAMM|nr:ATP-binding protein [Halomonas rituensis]RCV93880.1 ATP-binding protein [Halomonas rituensis]
MAKHQIQVGSQLIFHMIEGQAGSFSKALLEMVMNSVDGNASKVTITLDTEGFTVTDNGKGVQRLDDVRECLGTLGFDHGDNEGRVYGRYGLGRAQAWAFAPTTMRTSTHQMDVDIRKNGLEYDLRDDLPEQEGFTVTGRFYDPMLPSDVDRTERELEELAKYAQIPVILNGRSISKLPKDQKWDIETDDLYIKMQAKGQLSVYSIGVLVRHFPAHTFGTGGIVVSKKAFEVNVARNDILESKCSLWKEAKRLIRASAGERTRKSKALNDNEAEFLLHQLLSNEINFNDADVEKLRLLKDVTGKRHPIGRLRNFKEITFCTDDQKRLAIRVHEKGCVFVMHPSMMDMLNAYSVENVQAKLEAVATSQYFAGDGMRDTVCFRGNVRDFTDYADMFSDTHEPLDSRKDLTKIEQCALKAMNEAANYIPSCFRTALNERPAPRNIILGVSETAEAWTDGATYVAVERETAKLLRQGVSGATRLAGILIHEFCHTSSDLTGHGHPPEFYERFHEVMLASNGGVGWIANELLKNYAAALRKRGLKPTQAMLKAEDNDFKAANVA